MAKPKNIKYVSLLLIFLAAGFILRVNNLAGRSLWTDEFFTLFQSNGHAVDMKIFLDNLSHKQPPQLVKAQEFKFFLRFDHIKGIKDVSRGLLNTDTHPPLYFWLMYFLRRFFIADSVFALRLFSVLMGVLSIFLAYKVARHLFNRDVAIFSALFVSLSAFAVRYSQEARSYSLITALGLLSWLLILRMENYNKNLDGFCFAFFNAAGLYTHYFYIFISIAQFAYFTIAHRKDTARLRKFYLAFLSSALLFSPWFIALILKGYNFHLADWIFGYPGLINKAGYLFNGLNRYILMLDGSTAPVNLFLVIGLLLFFYPAAYAVKEMITRYSRQALFCLFMFLAPLLSMFFIDILQQGALLRQERFWIFPFLGFIPFAGYTLYSSFTRTRLALYALIFLMLVSCLKASTMQFGPAVKNTSSWVNQESKGLRSLVLVYNIRSVVFAQSYYLDDDIYLMPVSDEKQLNSAIKIAPDFADKVFIARHYHPSDPSLMNKPFMEIEEIGPVFKFRRVFYNDGIRVSEYVK